MIFGVFAAFCFINVLAYRHARAMTHFVASGQRTGGPEKLSALQKAAILFTGVQVPHPRSPQCPLDSGLPFTVHNIAGRRGQLEAWFVPHEKAKGLVLLFHGYAECKARLLPETRAFHDMGYACFLVDFPGSGGSEGDETTIGYREAEDVQASVSYAREKWPDSQLILFGRSMGSVAVLRALAVEGTRATAAILECPFDRMLSTIEARFAQMRVPSFPGADLLLFWGSVQLGFNGFDHNPAEYAAAVDCPVLLMTGDKDPNVSTEQTEAIYRSLHGRKKLHLFAGLGHEPYLAKQGREWGHLVGQFLDSQATADTTNDR
jgi:alpha-beta hydrolase superfamily lysophospholipase